MKINKVDFIWSVFVDGPEVNDYYMRFDDAMDLADEYLEDGYLNVALVDTDGNEYVR